MVGDRKEPRNPNGPFEDWKSLLRKDCELQDRLVAFQALGDSVLEILWKMGLSPTVQALTEGTAERPLTADWPLTDPVASAKLGVSNWRTPAEKGKLQ